MIRITNGRTHFFQWEQNQQLILDTPCGEVHFENGTQSKALCCEVKEADGAWVCEVPNELLQTAATLHAYAWDAEKTYVVEHAWFAVEPRVKPEGYVYTPTEIKNYDLLFKQTAYAKQLAEGAAADAKEADAKSEEALAIAKGRAKGYVFDTVEDLDTWLTDEAHRLELAVGDNFYIRALDVPDYWWDGAQKQPLETQKVEISGYVKNTDYATKDKAGVVKVNPSLYGVGIGGAGTLIISAADNAQISGKTNKMRPIVPANLDYAVKVGMTTNTIPLTSDEKAAALAWLGVTDLVGDVETALDGIIAVQNELIGGDEA